ncbi:hypothetical protein Q7C36_016049 [Tachysurus vachellii]|uniref:Uncharacterized protein n=1 Tax=Tachysurus vachellii TaxID=175792 RepID=A0AA88M7U3_TACVA|nr:hypothetical protein Q7C36_016049 [Tachysurus vachellii]
MDAELRNKVLDLRYQGHKLRNSVKQLEEILYEAEVTQAVMKQDLERAGEAYSILNSKHEETLKQHEESQRMYQHIQLITVHLEDDCSLSATLYNHLQTERKIKQQNDDGSQAHCSDREEIVMIKAEVKLRTTSVWKTGAK